jgi:hypothetical protein
VFGQALRTSIEVFLLAKYVRPMHSSSQWRRALGHRCQRRHRLGWLEPGALTRAIPRKAPPRLANQPRCSPTGNLWRGEPKVLLMLCGRESALGSPRFCPSVCGDKKLTDCTRDPIEIRTGLRIVAQRIGCG